MESTKSRVRHGSPWCANRYGCKRPECVEAIRAYHRENDANRRAGIKAYISNARALQYVNELLKAGMPPLDMEEISGVDVQTFLKMINGRSERIHWTVEEAILGIPFPEGEWEASGDCNVPMFPATRRIRALGVQGFTIPPISRESGVDCTVLTRVRAGARSRIRLSTMTAIRKAYDRLIDTDPTNFGASPGDVTRARKWAEREGWHPAEAWADIDDPDCEPGIPPSYVALTEDARWLMSEYGLTVKEAAERLGLTPGQLGAAMSHYSRAVAKGQVSA